MPTREFYKETKASVLVKHVLDIIHEEGEVFEIRIPKTKAGTISGYFNDHSKAATFVSRENGKHQAIYATVNPVQPALLARMENRLSLSQVTTTDAEITRRRWFLLDFDPVRPAGISSTKEELAASKDRAESVIEWLTSIGWPEPLQASSGNGWHLMYRIEEPNDDAARIDIECATKMLSSIFSDPIIEIDVTVYNASRVWKIYGTISAKGDDTPERPHRVAKVEKIPQEYLCVTRAQIENVARPLRDAKTEEYKDPTGEYILDMVKWLADRGQTVVSGPRPMFGREGQKWVISRCPFDHNHQNPIVGLVSNRPVFRCLHNSCSAYRWKEFREKVDPTYKDPDTIELRLREWCNSDLSDVDLELVQSAASTGKKLQGIIKKLRKDCTRARVLELEEILKIERRRFLRETVGENNEKGNIVGLISRTRSMQADGFTPMYWVADYDHRIRVGMVGDIDAPKLSTADEIALMAKFHSLGDSWVKQTHASQVITMLSEEYRVNPIRQWFKQKVWDGIKRLDTWLPHYMGTEDNVYTRSIGRKWVLSAVARGMEPGCQADHMLIFEGKQGIGKSQAARILGGPFYVEYSGGLKSGEAQKMVAIITGKLIIEMSELATLRRADMESLKAIITTPVDEARLSYERDAKSYPRTGVFLGTTNDVGLQYIMDSSGARRFWPCVVGVSGTVRTNQLKDDVNQLWAEAVEAFESGEDWYKVPSELVAQEQSDRQVTAESDPWFTYIRNSMTDSDLYNSVWYFVDEYVEGVKTNGFVIRLHSIAALLQIVIGLDRSRQSAMDVARMGRLLQAMNFKKRRPAKPWQGNSWAYDMFKVVMPHMWPAIEAIRKSTQFPMREDSDE